MTVQEARNKALKILDSPTGTDKAPAFARSPTPRLDCDVILSSLIGKSRSELIAHPETDLGRFESDFFAAIARRAEGIPVAYITGTKEFWGLPFTVTPDVLIPKADTETIVERAGAIIRELLLKNAKQTVRVIDVCTGSGCIAIALKHDFPSIDITATDISPKALAVARDNAANLLPGIGATPSGTHAIPPIRFIEGDLSDGLPEPACASEHSCAPATAIPPDGQGYDIVISNPPYVPSIMACELLRDGRGEPLVALDGGKDGLDLVRLLALRAKEVLARGGILLVETGEYNAREAAAFLAGNGYECVAIRQDLEGQDRVIEGIAK